MIQHKQDLKSYNTFGISSIADEFSTFSSLEELDQIIKRNRGKQLLILGGGSNILFTKDVHALVLRNEIKGFEIISEDNEHVLVKSGSGEIWHEFVLKCIELGFGGIENMSLIPGSVGASPMQNIGAYGMEIKDVFHSLEAYHLETGEVHLFNREQCEFGYRESVFKGKFKGQYVIISVTYRLNKQHQINQTYGAIASMLEEQGVSNPSIRDISNAVITIRQSKLPDPAKLGNAGSFFKNPVVDLSVMEKIKSTYPDVPNYPSEVGKCKLAAGWLIEKAGWKGFTEGSIGVHKLQALVLVNYGGAEGNQLFDLSDRIIGDIEKKFGVTLEREVNIW
jgi:UDP-N-acetylmuramate dehydrogenase